MSQVAKITAELAHELLQTTVIPTDNEPIDQWYFNPVQDVDGNWVISIKESEYLNPDDYEIINWSPIIEEEY